MRIVPLLSLTLSLLGLPAFGAGAELASAGVSPSDEPVASGTQSLIVKFREAPAGIGAAKSAARDVSVTAERARAAAVRAGLVLVESREIAAALQTVKVRATSSRDTLATTLARLRTDPAVEYAEPDHRRYVQAAPDDPIFQGSQWYLKNESSTPSAIDAVGAWDTTQGADDVVVAVIDTGVRFEHPDLRRASAGGRLLDGYDFITDITTANDGDGRDADASDAGDWCQESGSSWHGTRVSGIVGALTNNATGIAGATWRGRILPLRGLGKCGGNDSDLIAATLWAAGIPVAGVPDNPNPAKVINLSFGSVGACPASWRDAIARVSARGTLVVV
ncbi:MAG TPA: S8 family serine peptidase, partial [Steroidobacteraceae bacterium]|nr:S8 family serine peptidase [Steroidobacteraceae bacterium]